MEQLYDKEEWAIAAGDEKTGISIMRVEKEMDAGDVCARRELSIGDEDIAYLFVGRLTHVENKRRHLEPGVFAQQRMTFQDQRRSL